MRLGFVGVICGVMLRTANNAHADEKPWRLEYRRGANAPANCPDEAYLRTALAAKNGAPEPFSDNVSRTITIELVPTADRIEARIQARNEQGSVVSDQIAHAPLRRCDQLADRIVFVLHDIIDPIALPEPESPRSPSSPISSAPLSLPEKPIAPTEKPASIVKKPIVANPPTPKSPKTTGPKPRMAFSLSLGATWWNAPHTAFTSALGIGGRWRKFSFGIEAQYDRAWELPNHPLVRVEQLGLGIVGCGYHDFHNSRFYVRGCLFGDVSRLSVETEQVHAVEVAGIAVNFGARGGAGMSLAHNWAVELYGDGIVAVLQPRFVFNVQEYWQLPRFNGAVRASVVGLFDVF